MIQPDLYAHDTLNCDPDELEEDEAPATADADGLRCFLEGEVLSWIETRKKEMLNRPLIREQAFGEALEERMLAMLLRLKDLRRGRSRANPFDKKGLSVGPPGPMPRRGSRARDAATLGPAPAQLNLPWPRGPVTPWRNLSRKLAQLFYVPILASRRKPAPTHAAYIASWLKVLKDDKRAIFTAASHAQKAADYLHGLQSRAPHRGDPDVRGAHRRHQIAHGGPGKPRRFQLASATLGGRHAGDAACFDLPILQNRLRHIVPVTHAELVRMRRAHAVAAVVKEAAGQNGGSAPEPDLPGDGVGGAPEADTVEWASPHIGDGNPALAIYVSFGGRATAFNRWWTAKK